MFCEHAFERETAVLAHALSICTVEDPSSVLKNDDFFTRVLTQGRCRGHSVRTNLEIHGGHVPHLNARSVAAGCQRVWIPWPVLAREHRFDVPRLRRPRYRTATPTTDVAARTDAPAAAAAGLPRRSFEGRIGYGYGAVSEATDRPGTAACGLSVRSARLYHRFAPDMARGGGGVREGCTQGRSACGGEIVRS